MPGSLIPSRSAVQAGGALHFDNGQGDDGGRLSHAAVSANLLVAIHRACPIRQDFHVLSGGIVIHGPAGEELRPDVVVVQGHCSLGRSRPAAPILAVDVDEGDPSEVRWRARRDAYLKVPSLQAYFAASCSDKLVEVHRRFSGSWTSLRFEGHGLVGLPSLGCSVDLKAIYAGLTS
ncbi:Uma2 family endonuclease [Skermanella pratensis]|uniref:Uma2 family endonuclease n=1 Tax=Skermanella pratensis TaxID=2233999 RepID=UPI0017888435|nr:Uma2 family endonuclease [Skermanella pratensis]